MSFAESVKKFVKFNEFLNYILRIDNYRDSNTINIYHIHIGSKTRRYIDSSYSHNHEYTLFINTLFNNPLKQFSPEFISQLSNYPEIKIRNVVILIDPMYSHSPELEGYKENSSMTLPLHLINESVVQHFNDTITTITTSIDILQLPFDVTELDILKLIDILCTISHLYSVLIHIMDCTSWVMLECYANSMISPNYDKISIRRPDCLILDTLPLCNPIITCSTKNTHTHTYQHTHPGQISVRWVNYKDDMTLIPELEQVLDFCDSSKDTHTFLIEQYKHTIAIENLVSILKLWSRLSYTNLQEIDIVPDTYLHSDGSRTSTLSFKFCDLSFTDFISYWKNYTSFRECILSNVDSYYRYNLKVFLDTFIVKYKDISNHISIVKALQIEAIELFKNLINYCKTDAAYIITTIKSIEEDTTHLLERKHIMDYMKFNNVSI
jgi:hypothetical protein